MTLLTLPAELRNTIHEYALTAPPSSSLHFEVILDELQDTQPAHVFTFEGKIFNKLKDTCK
jgi:hypothetical protein